MVFTTMFKLGVFLLVADVLGIIGCLYDGEREVAVILIAVFIVLVLSLVNQLY